MTEHPPAFPLPTDARAPLETIKSPELIQNAFVVVPLCKWKLEPALCRLGKRFHHRHNAFPEFVKMLHDVSLTFFAVEKWNFAPSLSLSLSGSLPRFSALTLRCRFRCRINRLLIARKISDNFNEMLWRNGWNDRFHYLSINGVLFQWIMRNNCYKTGQFKKPPSVSFFPNT